MSNITKETIAGTMMFTAPTSTLFGFTMTNNEWADTAIGVSGFLALVFFQYQSMKDRREQREWDRKTERRKPKTL